MAKKKPEREHANVNIGEDVEIAGAGSIISDVVSETLRKNYMPYAMSVIVSRALPEIDGFKPSHRKLLYTMYQMGLLTGARTKSANVVGQTMKLNPHGDMAIYETMVRLSRGNETLLHAYVDSKGNFGKSYSRDMAFAASRYTEVKLASISSELFSDINKDTVDFVDNYDSTLKEPTLLPATFPTILVNSNIGIAVGMASAICPFNLAEVCETTVALLKDPNHDIASTLKAPDFPGGGLLMYEPAIMAQVYETGRGSIRIRSKYLYDKTRNALEITEIPPSTTVEAIIDKVAELVKAGKIKELNDMRDETDLKGLRITFDLKRGVDPEKMMQKLYKLTPLEDTFACNFTVLLDGAPRLVGVRELLCAWLDFRRSCIVRRTKFELKGKEERLHLLLGLEKILVDIDKAVRIVRETDEEKEVVPNLMIGFGIDETQANYIAEIKLRQLNREYILNRTSELGKLKEEIEQLRKTLGDPKLIDRVIMTEQAAVAQKYAQPRKTKIVYDSPLEYVEQEDKIPDYPVSVFYTREGYFKKITPQSLRMSGEHKLKEDDEIVFTAECSNDSHLLFFTNQRQVYKVRANDFSDTKASSIGEYVAAKLDMPQGELPVALVVTDDYKGFVVTFYENGKIAKVPLSSFETKLNRKKLTNAYCAKSDAVLIAALKEDAEYAVFSSANRMLLVNTALVPLKQAKDTLGVNVMTLKKGQRVEKAVLASTLTLANPHRYRTRNLPAAGATLKEEDVVEQLTLLDE